MLFRSLANENVITNYYAKKSRKAFQDVFGEVKEGKIGFAELCMKQDVKPYQQ